MRSSAPTSTVLLLAVATVLLLAVRDSHCAQLCMDSTFPRTVNGSLPFCGYNGTSCCNSTDDAALQRQFASMNISSTPCGDLVKSILCARCNPYAGELFTVTTSPRTVPRLCNSTGGVASRLTGGGDGLLHDGVGHLQGGADPGLAPAAATDYCMTVWDTCKEVRIPGSPFQPPRGTGAAAPTLTDVWQSSGDFCAALGGAPGAAPCFDGGETASFNATRASPPASHGICLERVGNGSYINMAPHPDGSSRVFLSNQAGKVFLAAVPAQGSGKTLGVDAANPFLDITDEVHFDNEFGLLGIAFHPDFAKNGRFFVSYSCDKTQSASCSGRCACNSDVGCDPSKLTADNGAQPCQFQSVIAEYTANILFSPADGYLYFMMGDGGSVGDPWNFAQNKKSLLGKIVRIDVNQLPTGNSTAGWGNYGIPKDNPFSTDSKFAPEVFALGFKNPWRCSFDSGKPSDLYCADVGQATYEEVDLVIKGGNYGWRVFEGTTPYLPLSSPGGNTSAAAIDAIPPVMGYAHSAVNNNVGSASITGGYVYRSGTDPCLSGRYLYADLYAQSVWAGLESPEGSGVYDVTSLPFACSKKSPIPCDAAARSSLPSLGYIFSFGQDNAGDVYLLTSKGVYRVVDPSECGYTCPIKSSAPGSSPSSSPGASASGAGDTARRSPVTAAMAVAGVLLALFAL
uniref:Glucose/Sorbosone dehydrogenase domain-containing protein n=1 Tax=Leersia perrieri TaxID=77586 RepID=A0A0D9WWG7_9ORYZ